MSFTLRKNLIKFGFCILKRFVGTASKVNDPCIDPSFRQGLVLGIYLDSDNEDKGKLTPAAERYNKLVNSKLVELLKYTRPIPKRGEVRLLYNLEDNFASVALVGLGRECQGYDIFEQIDEGKEAIRIAAAAGCQALQQLNFTTVFVESFGHAESAAEGAALGIWSYQGHKSNSQRLTIPRLFLHDDKDFTGWRIGLQKADAQNLARELMDMPANLLTPSTFSQNAVEVLCRYNINVKVRVKGWLEMNNMKAIIAASQGSCEPPILLELSYYGASRDERPVVLVGKGITYNSGGLCLKDYEGQKNARGELAGAACIVGACRAVAGLHLPINILALIPLCENMTGCAAMRPGDVVRALNGKNIHIQSSENAGQLVLADALSYAQNFWPRFIVDIGSMTPEMEYSLGGGASGVFSNSEILWEYMLTAAMHTGDRVWRFPLWECYKDPLFRIPLSDLYTKGKGKISSRGAAKAAAFLHEFVPCGDWLHLDIAGVKWTDGTMFKYLRPGMTGRPTRTLVEFLSQIGCHRE